LNVGKDTTLGDGDTRQELVEFLVVADGQLQMTGDDARLLVVTSGVASQFEHFRCQVFHYSREVHWCTCPHALSVVPLAKETVDTPDGELKSSTVGAALRLPLDLASLATTRHID